MSNEQIPIHVFMTAMFRDVEEATDRHTVRHEFADFKPQELLDADDALLVGKRARTLKTISIPLQAGEQESEKCNMRLNRGKCCQTNLDCSSQVKFHTGEHIKIVFRQHTWEDN